VTRDGVEKKRVEDKNPSVETIAKLIQLDIRLNAQGKKIAKQGTLEEAKKFISQNTWWWKLNNPEVTLDKAIKRYDDALKGLGAAPQGSTQEIPEKIKEVLLARDAIEQVRKEEKQLPQETIGQIIELDDDLWKQASVIANADENIQRWKVHFNPPDANWWWQITTESAYLSQCVERYEKNLQDLQQTFEPTQTQTLKLLRSRDALEKALKKSASLPESISERIIKLDRELKEQRLVLAKGKQLLNWKKSLNPPSSNWWWDFKPTLFGDEDAPLSWKDRIWLLGALSCLLLAGSFVVNTTQVFQSGTGATGKDKAGETTRSDPAQNALVIFQGAGLVSLTASAVTQKGQKAIEDLITSIPLIPPRWHAPTTFGLSVIALGVTYGINKSLPSFGQWYFDHGQQLEENAQLFQAKEQYLQAKKFWTGRDEKVKLTLALGGLYEQQQEFDNAITEYKNALGTDDPHIISHLGRALVLKESFNVGWIGKVPENKATLKQAKYYFQLVERKIKQDNKNNNQKGNKSGTADQQKNKNKELEKELYINQGLYHWSQVDFNQDKKTWKSNDIDNLESAKEWFQKADKLDKELPTTPDGRNARCYLGLTESLQEVPNRPKANPKRELNKYVNYCDKIMFSVSDINESNMMQSVYDLLYPKYPQESRQAENPENPENPEQNQTETSTENSSPTSPSPESPATTEPTPQSKNSP
jgi:hypothetical protein